MTRAIWIYCSVFLALAACISGEAQAPTQQSVQPVLPLTGDIFVPFGIPYTSSTTTAKWASANRTWFHAFVLARPMRISTVTVDIGVASGTSCTGGTCGFTIGIFDYGCTELGTALAVSGGTPDLNSTGIKTLTFSAPLNLQPGVYYQAESSDSTALKIRTIFPASSAQYPLLQGVGTRHGYGTASTGNGASITLPSTCGAITKETTTPATLTVYE